jgi:superfamily II DNA or RNA helicase
VESKVLLVTSKEPTLEVLYIPPCFSDEIVIDGNHARQLLILEELASLYTSSDSTKVTIGQQSFRVIRRNVPVEEGERVLIIPPNLNLDSMPDLRRITSVHWSGHLVPHTPGDVLESLRGAFHFQAEDPDRGISGLRDPQLGALHSVLGYWTTRSSTPATVVMPTGTGKTETMLSLFASARLQRLLVVVPSDALRDQIASKFETFGVLQNFGVVARDALRPIVGRIRHRFTSENEARSFVESCNIIVTTPNSLYASDPHIRAALLASCSHLFVDEAHHVAAATWQAIRDGFAGRPVVQFTATPFREDGKHLGGHLLYAFPLREAQKQGYFSKINYVSVVDFDNPDLAIAQRAVDQLRRDLENGFDHLLMARVNRIGRAREILDLYSSIAGELNPVIIHSNSSQKSHRASLSDIRLKRSRIIVCVDMLGEGFDLPSLKIAAIHDPHKSLGVTLQFIGRFARTSNTSIGDATVVVGRPDGKYDGTLRKLYAEDADWNQLIRDISEMAVGHQQKISDFETNFTELPESITLRSLFPKMSAVVYRSKSSDWKPEEILSVYPEESLVTVPIGLNLRDGVAWFVTEECAEVSWGDVKMLEEISHHLYILYWDAATRLLYIHSSNNDILHEELAAAVCGKDVERIKGENIYRAMANVERLVPTNVGVVDVRNRARRFSMHVGADVTEGFPIAEAQTKTKTNIFAYGFEEGDRVSIGAALKGRIWSHRVAGSIKDWMMWCDDIGRKLTDTSVSVDEVLAHFIRPQVVESRPCLVPLGLEWPWELFLSTTEEVCIEQEGSTWPLVDVALELKAHSISGSIPFNISTPNASNSYELNIARGAMKFRACGTEAYICNRRSRKPLSEFLSQHGLIIHFEKDAIVEPPGILLQPNRDLPPYDPTNMKVLDWNGVNLRKESQGPGRDSDSIQARVIEHLQASENWDILIDDDGSGEIADVVAMRLGEDILHVCLVHCKFSSEESPGARIGDLYEVCGQAQKSARWKRNMELMFDHLIRREKKRKDRHGRSGIILGDGNQMYALKDKSRLVRAEFLIVIAQPGLARNNISLPSLELLASTEVYLYETAHAKLEVYCSP